ncbi:MAG TPA: methyltransferase MtaB domain-containing protein [Bacillota bacterium]
MMNAFKQIINPLAYHTPEDMLFGRAPRPVTGRNGMVIGGGTVYPEINFTLPPMPVESGTIPDILKEYRQIIQGVCERAVVLHSPGIVVEVELLPPMTVHPQWGLDVVKVVKDTLISYEAKQGLKSLLRVTPNDTREMKRPPLLYSGLYWENMLVTFEESAKAGADFLAIESTGGKEICDDALMNGDIASVIFALGVLGAYDMKRLWQEIVAIATKYNCIASGDTACGFGNTAMILAEQGYISKVFAAAVRVATVPRSLIAYEAGAVGPSKDCAYEGPYMKVIAGVPIAMEGKSSACAHLSPLGNIAGAICDLWSNESVQNIKLLGGMAPTVSMEQLIYDTRLMNQASQEGFEAAVMLRDWMVESDSRFDPQAYVLRPDFVFQVSRELMTAADPYRRTKKAVSTALQLLREGVDEGRLALSKREQPYLERLSEQLAGLPDDPAALWENLRGSIPEGRILPSEYQLAEIIG